MSTPAPQRMSDEWVSTKGYLLKFHGNNFEEFYSFQIYAHIAIGKLITHFSFPQLKLGAHCYSVGFANPATAGLFG
jgi:hypothetical protein